MWKRPFDAWVRCIQFVMNSRAMMTRIQWDGWDRFLLITLAKDAHLLPKLSKQFGYKMRIFCLNCLNNLVYSSRQRQRLNHTSAILNL